jgi:hypothetical protein
VGNKSTVEPNPKYIQADAEKVIDKGNSYIVLGKDRPESRMSGYGGRGDTGANAIDIVVGRMGSNVADEDKDGKRLHVDPNFELDAARIHISQKTDIDKNFGLKEGNIGNFKGRSGIGVKADGVRIMGREGIKLVTGLDDENSQGGQNQSVKGIDLMAGNDDSDLQPLLKGDNTAKAIEELAKRIKKLYSILENFLSDQLSFNLALANHSHPPTAGPSPTAISAGNISATKELVNAVVSMPPERFNMEAFSYKYLEPIGDDYIKSRFNTTN